MIDDRHYEFHHGRWLECKNGQGFYCSMCHYKVKRREALSHEKWDNKKNAYVIVMQPFRFCPHCGTKMAISEGVF